MLMALDVMALLLSLGAALVLRFDYLTWETVGRRYIEPHLSSLILAGVVYIFLYSKFRLYRYAWRFASLDTLWSVISANALGLAGFIALQLMFDKAIMPCSVLIVFFVLSVAFSGGLRILLRLISINGQNGKSVKDHLPARRKVDRKRAVIVGCGSDGAAVLRAVKEDLMLHCQVIGFLDDDPQKIGTFVSNVRVIGSVDMLKQLVCESAVDEVIVALPTGVGSKLREHILECRRRQISVKVVPHVHDVLKGDGSFQLVDFSVEDLLRRKPARINVAEIGGYLAGKRVLVTGAGGSIGSELCRQIMLLGPASLILFGHGENSIHAIWQELIREWPAMADSVRCVIGSVANERRVQQVFEHHRPEVVFHAAAHKHVPMMENNECEAVHNNVHGTLNVGEMCGRYGAERIVLISTDKAADPCCVMGATKRMCEEVVRAQAQLWPDTCYVAVRFGNVLGSRGSVVPMFKDQIRYGGPVTVTHPEMTRYFMTIPEAVRLVLQAGAVGRSGDLYLLDMGDPVKILDLAHDMIRLCGLEPDVDIKVEFSGIRPGEKLHERLVASDETVEATPWEGLSLVHRPQYMSVDDILIGLNRLQDAANSGNPARARAALYGLIPDTCNKGSGSVAVEDVDSCVQDSEPAPRI